MSMSIDDESITISGCNTHTFNYTAYENGGIEFSENILSTKKSCFDDIDKVFVQSVFRANQFVREQGNTLYFLLVD